MIGTAAHIARVQRDGFTVVENAIEPALVDALSAALQELELERERDAQPAMNGFEGHKAVRIYNLPKHGAPFAVVPVHANVLPVIEGVLDPGATERPIHADGNGGDDFQSIWNRA